MLIRESVHPSIHLAVSLNYYEVSVSTIGSLYCQEHPQQAPSSNLMRPEHLYESLYKSVEFKRTNGPIDGWTTGRTHPLIEMQGRISNLLKLAYF